MEIKNKVIWVTGGNSGLGLAAAKYFVTEGARVMITARRAKQLAEAANEMGENCMWVAADSTKVSDLKGAVKECVEKWGHLDVLVNTAGNNFGPRICTAEGTTDDDDTAFEATVALNLTASFYAARLAAIELQDELHRKKR